MVCSGHSYNLSDSAIKNENLSLVAYFIRKYIVSELGRRELWIYAVNLIVESWP